MPNKKRGRGRALSLPRGVKANSRNRVDALHLVSGLPDASIALVFLDPQYRTGLDKMKYGNEGTRQIKRYKLPQQKDHDIQLLVEEVARVLKPSGYLMLWLDKFGVVEGTHRRYIRRLRRMVGTVDMLAWDKVRMGMGKRFRAQMEYLVVIQKNPITATNWKDHDIRDLLSEKKDLQRHPHAKPINLAERIIESVTKRNDWVLDPCAGSYGILSACRASGRNFIGGDLL